jgi:hypothetical protein
MGIPLGETLTITLNAYDVASLECLLQEHLCYVAEEGTREARHHDTAERIYELLSEADRKAGRFGV